MGVPFNIASCATLLMFMAKLTGYTPGKFVHHMNDVHIYENAMEGTEEMLSRIEKPLPTLTVTIPDVKMKIANSSELAVVRFDDVLDANFNHTGFNRVISNMQASNFQLIGYDPHPGITVDMAV